MVWTAVEEGGGMVPGHEFITARVLEALMSGNVQKQEKGRQSSGRPASFSLFVY